MDPWAPVTLCRRIHDETRRSAARAADRYLVTRNWLFGWYIVRYEDGGSGRSKLYGRRLITHLSDPLTSSGLKGCSPTNLRKFRELYHACPEIQQTLSVESVVKLPAGNRQTSSVTSASPMSDGQAPAIGPTLSDQLTPPASDDRAAPIGPTPSDRFASPEPARRRPRSARRKQQWRNT